MALAPLADLIVRKDVKGGSPRTPTGGIPQQDYQQFTVASENGNGIYKMLAGAAGGLWVMAMLAWWTAFQGRGITREELRNEIKEYKDSVAKDMAILNNQIGEVKGQTGKMSTDLNQVQYRQLTDEQNYTEFKTETKNNSKLVADWIEAQKVKK